MLKSRKKDIKSILDEIIKLEGFLDKNFSCRDYLEIDDALRVDKKFDLFSFHLK